MRARHIAGVIAGLICVGAMAGAARAEEEKLGLRMRVMRAYVKAFCVEDPRLWGPTLVEDLRRQAGQCGAFAQALEEIVAADPKDADLEAVKELQRGGVAMMKKLLAAADLGGMAAMYRREENWQEIRKLLDQSWRLELTRNQMMEKWALEHFGMGEMFEAYVPPPIAE